MTTLDDARAIYCFGFIHVSLALSQTGKSDRNGIPDFSYGPRASKAADILTKTLSELLAFALRPWLPLARARSYGDNSANAKSGAWPTHLRQANAPHSMCITRSRPGVRVRHPMMMHCPPASKQAARDLAV